MNKINLKEFVNSYLATAAWVTCDSGENQNFTKDAKEEAKEECEKFISAVTKKLGEEKANELLSIPANDLQYLAPHCFFLNRNGHGSGFWDREPEFGEYANILSEISHELGGHDCLHERGKSSKLTFF